MEQHDDILVARSPHGYFRWMVLLAMVVLVDATLYRSHGYAGAAVFFPVALDGYSIWKKFCTSQIAGRSYSIVHGYQL